MLRKLAYAGGLALALFASAAAAQLLTFDHDQLAVESETGVHKFDVELAISPEQRAQGLMFREQMPADAGMIFLYSTDQMITMWMKNTLIPLDMVFVAADGRVTLVAERAVPGSTATISSGQPARAVIELNGGTAARLKIKPGDRVLFRTFGTAE